MENPIRLVFTILILHLPIWIYSQTTIQKSAEIYVCNCIDSLITNNSKIVADSLIVNCFYKGVSNSIEDKYMRNGKLKMSGKKFIIVSGELLYYLQLNLYNSCTYYKKYIDDNERPLIKFK